MHLRTVVGLSLTAVLSLAGCGEPDAPSFSDELGTAEQEAITCTGPQGDAYGNGPDGVGVMREIREWFGSGDRGDKAIRVARCESGYWANCCTYGGGTKAHYNDSSQYKGLFQMGEAERAKYGFNWCAPAQVKAAFNLWKDQGWAPWGSCAL